MSVLSSTQDQPKYKHKPESMVFKTGLLSMVLNSSRKWNKTNNITVMNFVTGFKATLHSLFIIHKLLEQNLKNTNFLEKPHLKL